MHSNDIQKNSQLTPRIRPQRLSCWLCLLRCNWRSSGQYSMGSHSASKEESIYKIEREKPKQSKLLLLLLFIFF